MYIVMSSLFTALTSLLFISSSRRRHLEVYYVDTCNVHEHDVIAIFITDVIAIYTIMYIIFN